MTRPGETRMQRRTQRMESTHQSSSRGGRSPTAAGPHAARQTAAAASAGARGRGAALLAGEGLMQAAPPPAPLTRRQPLQQLHGGRANGRNCDRLGRPRAPAGAPPPTLVKAGGRPLGLTLQPRRTAALGSCQWPPWGRAPVLFRALGCPPASHVRHRAPLGTLAAIGRVAKWKGRPSSRMGSANKRQGS